MRSAAPKGTMPSSPARQLAACSLLLACAIACIGAPAYAAAADTTEAKSPQDAAFQRGLTQLRTMEQAAARGKWAEAKTACTAIMQAADVPAYQRWEAETRLKEIERLEKGLPARDPAAHRLVMRPRPKPAVVLFVAPEGNDAHPGTKQQPLKTLESARDAVRKLKQSGKLPAGGVEVCIADGEYPVTQTLELAADDSGTEQSPIVYRAADGAKPRFRGGIRLRGFQPVHDAQILQRLPEESRTKVLCLDLKPLGVGQIKPLVLGGFQSGRGFETHPLAELFFDGRAMPMARWPNEGFVHVSDVSGPTIEHRWGRVAAKEGRLKLDDDRIARWTKERDMWLHGYWCYDWADSYELVASVDPAKHEIVTAPPYHLYGFCKGQRFYVVNALAEIDMPGEWYLDRSNSILYFWPPSDPEKADIDLSLNDFPFLRMQGVSHVTMEGLTWELGGGDAIQVRDGDHCLFAGCTVRYCGGNGMDIGGGTDHGVLSCDIYSFGRGGITISGGNRKTLAPGRHCIENCHIHDLSRIDHTYTPAIVMTGVGNRIAHNLMHDIASSAIRLGGNDHVVEYNEVYRVVLESDDQGGADMFGDPLLRGNVYRFNYWHHVGDWRRPEGIRGGIRLDDAISGVLVYGNVFYRASSGRFGGVQIHGGKENIIDNNIFAECESAISFSPWGEARWKEHIAGRLQSPEIDEKLYLSRYPSLARLADDCNRNTISRSLVFRCNEFLCRDSKRNELIDNLVTNDDPGFRNAAHGDLQLKDDSPAAIEIGLRPIPFDEIGLYVDAFRKELPKAGRTEK